MCTYLHASIICEHGMWRFWSLPQSQHCFARSIPYFSDKCHFEEWQDSSIKKNVFCKVYNHNVVLQGLYRILPIFLFSFFFLTLCIFLSFWFCWDPFSFNNVWLFIENRQRGQGNSPIWVAARPGELFT